MKKRIWQGFVVLVLALFMASCADLNYEAYITVANIGNLSMTVWVDGDPTDIAAFESQTWAIALEQENEYRDVLLEAEPPDGSDYDSIIITLRGDRDVQTWLTGWDGYDGYQPGGRPLKKQSSLLKGTPGKGPSPSRR